MTTIFCFTSTGNSLYAAKIIAEKTGGEVVPMRGDSADVTRHDEHDEHSGELVPMPGNPPVCGDEAIGFVFPVYFWGLPRMMERFVKDLRIEDKEAYIFSVATYGGATQGVHGILDRLLKPKGVALHYGKNLKSVENYLPEFKVNDSEAMRKKNDENARQIAEAVSRGERNRIYAPTFINKLSQNSYPDENSDRFFTVSPECTGCAVCQKVCPADNITMDSGRPLFNHTCENCLACLHSCPKCAIDWKNKTKGKARYRNPGISLDELISFNA